MSNLSLYSMEIFPYICHKLGHFPPNWRQMGLNDSYFLFSSSGYSYYLTGLFSRRWCRCFKSTKKQRILEYYLKLWFLLFLSLLLKTKQITPPPSTPSRITLGIYWGTPSRHFIFWGFIFPVNHYKRSVYLFLQILKRGRYTIFFVANHQKRSFSEKRFFCWITQKKARHLWIPSPLEDDVISEWPPR